jgi:hypothetical protein
MLGESSYVRCTLDYAADGFSRESTVNVGESIFSSRWRKPWASVITLSAMHAWIRRHPSGSVLTVHYDPSDSGRISMAGADRELRTGSPKDEFQFGMVGTVIGMVVLALVRVATKRLGPSQ